MGQCFGMNDETPTCGVNLSENDLLCCVTGKVYLNKPNSDELDGHYATQSSCSSRRSQSCFTNRHCILCC